MKGSNNNKRRNSRPSKFNKSEIREAFDKDKRRPNSSKDSPRINDPSSMNDIGWYSRNPELLAAAARIPFPYRPGMQLPDITWASADGSQGELSSGAMTIPGVMQLVFGYSVGYSNDVNSPASIAARELYGKIRAQFSGTSLVADAPDIFLYCMALDQIHAYIAWLKRLYRTLNAYSPDNRNLPDGLCCAYSPVYGQIMPKQCEVLRHELPTLWGYINTLVHMANKFSVPMNMDIYHRHRWMNEHVFTDAPGVNSQLFVFTPRYFYELDETNPHGTSLKAVGLPSLAGLSSNCAKKLYEYGYDLIKLLSDWDEAYIINGYVAKAFEGAPMYTVDLLQMDETLSLDYVPEVLTQIENAEVVGGNSLDMYSDLDITQDPNTNAIIHRPALTGGTWLNHNHVINMHTDNPTAADVTIATRLKTIVDEDNGYELHPATEFLMLVQMYVWVRDFTSGTQGLELKTIPWSTTNRPVVGGTYADRAIAFAVATTFQHSPIQVSYFNGFEESELDRWKDNTPILIGNIHNITVVPDEQLTEINRVCVYSEFNCFQ